MEVSWQTFSVSSEGCYTSQRLRSCDKSSLQMLQDIHKSLEKKCKNKYMYAGLRLPLFQRPAWTLQKRQFNQKDTFTFREY